MKEKPIEKAKHLIRQFKYATRVLPISTFDVNKVCALFCINETIESLTDRDLDVTYELKVRNHIEKLQLHKETYYSE